MATYPSVTARGASGSAYQFQLYPAGTDFKPLPGLYFFGRPLPNGNWHCVYIGQTHDFQTRVGSGLGNHHQYLAAKRLGFTHVGVHVFQGRESDRLGVEGDLIRGVKPELNGCAPSADRLRRV